MDELDTILLSIFQKQNGLAYSCLEHTKILVHSVYSIVEERFEECHFLIYQNPWKVGSLPPASRSWG